MLYALEGRDLRRFKKTLDTYQPLIAEAETDREYAAMLRRDLRSLNAVYRHLRAGRYPAALRIIDNLDTVVKDEIPARLFNAVWLAVRPTRQE